MVCASFLTASTPPATTVDDFTVKAIIAIIGILGAVAVALLSALIGRSLAVGDRRREQYGEAYKTAVEWREMVFRVRRRSAGGDGELVSRFHELHERIAFHEGWIGSESAAMRKAFRTLQTSVRDQTRADIRDAWAAKPGTSQNLPVEQQLSYEQAADEEFLKAVRRHLSWQPWRRIALVWSQRKSSSD